MAELQPTPNPVLRVTKYDFVSSLLLAIVIALGVSVVALTLLWATIRPSPPKRPLPVEIVEFGGGVEDGVPGETLRVDSDAPESADPSLAETPTDENVVQDTLDTMVEMAPQAAVMVDQQFDLETRRPGKPGSSKGTGRRGLGTGGGIGGTPRDQRWFVSFSDQTTLEDYAKQLEYFGIELGALIDNKEIVYLSQLTAKTPRVRRSNSGADEKRIYMIWQGGNRRKADIELFRRAGVQVGQGQIFQFYPAATEEMLVKLERDYRNRPIAEIRRTYFTVEPQGAGYTFRVTQQAYYK